MIHENVEFQGIAEARPVAGRDGLRLQRAPEELRLKVNERAQIKLLQPGCAEIRWVADGPTRLTLSCAEGAIDAMVFFGDFQHNQRVTIRDEPQTLDIQPPQRLWALDPARLGPLAFSPRVCRVRMVGGPVLFHGVEGEGIRPPRADELPDLRLLTYGTSITHGSAATGPHLRYVAQLAWRLRADLTNLGVGGACWCEGELADWIAARDDWDAAVLALSVNMIGAGFPLDEFHERVSYMVNTVAGADTTRRVACVTIYPHGRDFGEVNPDAKGTPDEYRQKLRDAVAACPHDNVSCLEGPEILSEYRGVTTDLIHPGDHGMIEMGENLAARMADVFEPLRGRRSQTT